jgi:hypothetical protein
MGKKNSKKELENGMTTKETARKKLEDFFTLLLSFKFYQY